MLYNLFYRADRERTVPPCGVLYWLNTYQHYALLSFYITRIYSTSPRTPHRLLLTPRLDKYSGQLIPQLNQLVDESILMNDTHHVIKVRAIITDAPARTFIKGMAFSPWSCHQTVGAGVHYNRALHTWIQNSIAVLHTSPKCLTDSPICLQTSIGTLQTSPYHFKHSTEWIK